MTVRTHIAPIIQLYCMEHERNEESTMTSRTESHTWLHERRLLVARLAWLLFTLTCILSALSFVFLALSWTTPVPDTWGFRGDAMLLALAFGGIGLLLARRHPQNPIGWLLLLAGLVSSMLEFCVEYATYALLTKSGALPYGTLAAWTASWIWVAAIGMFIYSFLLFPTGHLPSERWRPVAWFFVGAFGLMTFAFMIRPGPLYFAPYLENPFAVQVAYRVLSPIPVAIAAAVLLVGISVILRLRRAEGVERQQLKWFAYAATLRVIFGMSESVAGALGLKATDPKFYEYLSVAIWIAIAVAIAFAILRYRLWDIDIIINRTLVYGALTASVIGIYVIVVGTLGTTIQGRSNLLVSILATGLVAVLVQPLRDRLQRGVNRMMYGERDDPVTVLSRLGQRLEGTLAPDAVLPSLVETVAQTLKLPYVAIEPMNTRLDSQPKIDPISTDLSSLTISYGSPQPDLIRLPLVYQSETIGQLLVSPRAPGEALSPMDKHLLENIAHQAGMAVHAVSLTADLQRSRQRLVTTREEERRRLRRDLHDGLGPNLASQGLKLAAVKQLMISDPATAIPLLEQVMTQNKSTVEDVRRLVYGLRPPALDELGLVAAIRDHISGMDGRSTLQIVITEPEGGLPPLSAAVEVAAYRIVMEALTNVIRHAQARHCTIRFSAEQNGSKGFLRIEIQDDGIGLPDTHRAGIGTRSMHERAEELGGTCVIESVVSSGTRIRAQLPLMNESNRSAS